jgi:predicted transcriptional regulator
MNATECSITVCNALQEMNFMTRAGKKRPPLSELEYEVLQIVARLGNAKADDVRQALAPKRTLKESTVRTVLSRLESKKALTHSVDGRTYVYRTTVQPESVGVAAVRSVAERFFSGSFSKLLLGMADHEVITPDELRKLANMIDKTEQSESKES